MIIDYQLLGQRIAKCRKGKSISQEKLAEMADISNNYLSNIENSHSIPSLETLLKICIALNVTPDELLLGIASTEQQYLTDEILEKINACAPEEKRMINKIIDVILSEHVKKKE